MRGLQRCTTRRVSGICIGESTVKKRTKKYTPRPTRGAAVILDKLARLEDGPVTPDTKAKFILAAGTALCGSTAQGSITKEQFDDINTLNARVFGMLLSLYKRASPELQAIIRTYEVVLESARDALNGIVARVNAGEGLSITTEEHKKLMEMYGAAIDGLNVVTDGIARVAIRYGDDAVKQHYDAVRKSK